MIPSISVVVRCLNEERHIGRLLTGIERQTRPPDEVIVVDSGSTDATVAIAHRFGAEVVHIAPSEFSFGRALNIGLAKTSSAIAVIASAHVYPLYDTWIEELTRPFDNEATAVSYGRQIGGEGTKFSEHRLFAQWFPKVSTPSQDHPFCNNANAAVRRVDWERWPYDEDLTGLEDLAWATRAMRNGRVIAYSAEAVVAHIHNERFRQVLNRYRREAIAHKSLYPGHHVGGVEAAALAVRHIANDAWHAVGQRRLHKHLPEIAMFRVAQFLGTAQGFRHRGPVTGALRERFYYPSGIAEGDWESGSTSDVGRLIEYGDG